MSPFTKVTEPRREDTIIAWTLFACAFVALWATQRGVGYVRDESFYFLAAHNHAGWFELLFSNPGAAFQDRSITRFFGYNNEHPGLMKNLYGLSYLVIHKKLGLFTPAEAYRLPAFAIAAWIAPLLYRLGSGMYGRTAGLFAALAFFLVPRQFFNAHLAAFDVPVAAFWLFTVYAFWRAQRGPRWWLWCGVAFGLGLATKHNSFFLPVVLAPFCIYLAFKHTAPASEGRSWVWAFLGSWVAAVAVYGLMFLVWRDQLLARFTLLSPHTLVFLLVIAANAYALWKLRPLSVGAFRALASATSMAALGPLVLYLGWPYLWHHPVDRVAFWMDFHARHNHYAWFYLGELLRAPPFPLTYVLVKTALTVPTSLFVPMVLGFLTVAARLVATLSTKLRGWTDGATWEDTLVVVNAAFSIILISHPQVPHFGGVKHWFPSMLFLSILGGLAVASAARWAKSALTAKRRMPEWVVPSALCALLFAPALWASIRIHPYGTSAYSELAGGAPGAANLGMQRQFWSNNVTGVLPWINEHAPPNARIFFHEVTDYAVGYYKDNGLLRQDIRIARDAAGADLVAYQYHQEFREHEFSAWEALRTRRPVTGLYVDETPQVVVYQR